MGVFLSAGAMGLNMPLQATIWPTPSGEIAQPLLQLSSVCIVCIGPCAWSGCGERSTNPPSIDCENAKLDICFSHSWDYWTSKLRVTTVEKRNSRSNDTTRTEMKNIDHPRSRNKQNPNIEIHLFIHQKHLATSQQFPSLCLLVSPIRIHHSKSKQH